MEKINKQSYSDPIPDDILINIMSKLPLKSKALCRCVSKQWSSIIRSRNYKQLFPIKSPAPPRLLIALEVDKNFFYYSSPQPQNPDENSSLVATLHLSKPSPGFYVLCPPVQGLIICRRHFGPHSVVIVSNPITGEYVTLPELSVQEITWELGSKNEQYLLGYDPIDEQFKVLGISWFNDVVASGEFQVLTLGTGTPIWREKHDCTEHYPLSRLGHEGHAEGICINGVLYYPAEITNDNDAPSIVCFDVRSEKFSFVRMNLDLKIYFAHFLINYKGKLGMVNKDYNALELWVLEDAKKHKWSKQIYQISNPSLLLGNFYLRCAGIISSGNIVFYYEKLARDSFFIYYYNLEKKTITRVRTEVPVPKEFQDTNIHAFSNFVEDVNFM